MFSAQGRYLGALLSKRIPLTLLGVAAVLQFKILFYLGYISAVFGGLMWLLGMPYEMPFIIALICVGTWITTTPFGQFIVGMASAGGILLSVYVIAGVIAVGCTLLLTLALQSVVAAILPLPPAYSAAVMTGMCASPIFLAYALWYCQQKLQAEAEQ